MALDVEKVIREYLPDIIHMSLGTCADGKPWVCEVHYVYDHALNLYFLTKPTTRHGKEIAQNSNVAGNIVMQHGLNEKPRGVYFEGTAEALTEKGADGHAYKLYSARFDLSPEALQEVEQEGYCFYKVAVGTFYVFDSRESESGTKHELKWGKK